VVGNPTAFLQRFFILRKQHKLRRTTNGRLPCRHVNFYLQRALLAESTRTEGNWDGRWGGSVYSSSTSSDIRLISDCVRGKGKFEGGRRRQLTCPMCGNCRRDDQSRYLDALGMSRAHVLKGFARSVGGRTGQLWSSNHRNCMLNTRSSVQTHYIRLIILLS